MENGENKNLQGRREFFKEAAKKALPILGVVALMSNPMIAKAINTALVTDSEKENYKNDDPEGKREKVNVPNHSGCYFGCSGGCDSSCTGTCAGNCYGCYSCTGTCLGNCYGCYSCTGTCLGNCYGCYSCTGTCRGTCFGLSY
jgi:hypothetical protein